MHEFHRVDYHMYMCMNHCLLDLPFEATKVLVVQILMSCNARKLVFGFPTGQVFSHRSGLEA